MYVSNICCSSLAGFDFSFFVILSVLYLNINNFYGVHKAQIFSAVSWIEWMHYWTDHKLIHKKHWVLITLFTVLQYKRDEIRMYETVYTLSHEKSQIKVEKLAFANDIFGFPAALWIWIFECIIEVYKWCICGQ